MTDSEQDDREALDHCDKFDAVHEHDGSGCIECPCNAAPWSKQDCSCPAESDEWHCYPCSAGRCDECRGVAWQPDVRCQCPHTARLGLRERVEALRWDLRRRPNDPNKSHLGGLQEAARDLDALLADDAEAGDDK